MIICDEKSISIWRITCQRIKLYCVVLYCMIDFSQLRNLHFSQQQKGKWTDIQKEKKEKHVNRVVKRDKAVVIKSSINSFDITKVRQTRN